MLALAVVAVVTAPAISGAAAKKPALRLSGPLALQGRNFRAREVVSVSFTGPDFRRLRRVRTSAAGSFLTRIPPHGPCGGPVLVVAKGAAGDIAKLRLALKKCGPVLPPIPS